MNRQSMSIHLDDEVIIMPSVMFNLNENNLLFQYCLTKITKPNFMINAAVFYFPIGLYLLKY